MFRRRAPLLILLGAVLVVAAMMVSRPQKQARPQAEKVYPVEVQQVRFAPHRPQTKSYGEVFALREVELRSEVAGEIVWVAEQFAEGGYFEREETLLRIDPFDYERALATEQANVAAARAVLAERHTAFYLAWADVKRGENLFARGTISLKTRDDFRAAYLIAKARYRQQKAATQRTAIQLTRAERNLADTQLRAPASGYASQIQAQIGQQVSPTMRLANFIDAESYEVRFNISDTEYGRFLTSQTSLVGSPVRVRWLVGAQSIELAAEVSRQGSRIARSTRGIDLYARLQDAPPENLRVGAFVEVVLEGTSLPRAMRLPRYALINDEAVFVVQDGSLVVRPVTIAARDGSFAYITEGVAEEEAVLLTQFDEARAGTKVLIKNE